VARAGDPHGDGVAGGHGCPFCQELPDPAVSNLTTCAPYLTGKDAFWHTYW